MYVPLASAYHPGNTRCSSYKSRITLCLHEKCSRFFSIYRQRRGFNHLLLRFMVPYHLMSSPNSLSLLVPVKQPTQEDLQAAIKEDLEGSAHLKLSFPIVDSFPRLPVHSFLPLVLADSRAPQITKEEQSQGSDKDNICGN